MARSFNDLSSGLQTVVLVSLAVALAFAALWYLALPQARQREDLHSQVIRIKGENDRNEAFKREQTEYVNRIAQLTEQLQTLRSIVPDDPATDVFVKSVYDAGTSVGVHIRTFIAHKPVEQELYVEMPFTLHLDGSYYDLVRFFSRLANEQRIVTVSSLALGQPEGGGMGAYNLSPQETVGANCIVTTYYNRPTAPGGATVVRR